MKITRQQLRKLINEAMIKPGIPNVPSEEAQGKIDDLARQEEFQASADSMADVFGYPEGQSYSADLRTYDQFGRLGASISVMRELGTKYADAETHGEPEEYYIRRDALRKAAEICDSFDMSMVKPLIDAFTDAANDYERAYMKRLIGASPRFEYEAYDIAGRISLKSHKLDFDKKENYSNLYDGTYINETRIKPSIPNIPSDDSYIKIDDLARGATTKLDADSMAGAFGYPEDRSYSEDLRIYDEAGMPTLETVSVYRHPSNIEIVIPQELVDDVIDAHRESQTMGWPAASVFREAAIRVFHHVENETKRIAGNDKNVYEYGLAVRGYRADEYQAAMEAVGEYL